tara:strand:+ start:897 stop:2006 length:1110 start_codon:yes stop_codon:yes gene_type:complete
MVDKRVLKKMLPYFSEKFNNPHSQLTMHNKDIIKNLEKARAEIARLIGAEKEEIIFTSGATEANNLAIKGMMSRVLRGKNHFISLNTEHKCVLEALRKLELKNCKLTILNVKKNGLIDLNEFKKSINNKTVLVSIMMANNETGVIQPIEKIAQICKEKKILFHTDAAQAIGKISVNVKKMKIDMMSISAHKFYGPKGIGALYIKNKPRIRIDTLIDGGGQERNLRSGTLPVPLCIGFGEAAKIARNEFIKDFKKTKLLRDNFINALKKKIKGIKINGCMRRRLPGNINLSIPGIKSYELISKLEKTVISSGSACTSSSIESSYVLEGMKLTPDIVESSIRIGIGKFNSQKEINIAIKELEFIVHKMRVL